MSRSKILRSQSQVKTRGAQRFPVGCIVWHVPSETKMRVASFKNGLYRCETEFGMIHECRSAKLAPVDPGRDQGSELEHQREGLRRQAIARQLNRGSRDMVDLLTGQPISRSITMLSAESIRASMKH